MNTKHYLVTSGIVGGVIGSLLTALLVSPVTADRDEVGVIECTELRVVDAKGSTLALVSGGEHGGSVQVGDKESQAVVNLNLEAGGTVECRRLQVVDGNGEKRVRISNGDLGGV